MTSNFLPSPAANAVRTPGSVLIRALRSWTPRQILAAALTAIIVAVVIGIATVLIPNPIFARDIPPVWWNYPVWLITSALSGILLATYVRPDPGQPPRPEGDDATSGTSFPEDSGASVLARSERRTSRMGMAGGVLAWFAVGCPVCNKIALLALGYSGAITYFTPIQPFLALGAMVLTGVAVVVRLRGQVSCPVPARGVA